jgi:hypothetical protein
MDSNGYYYYRSEYITDVAFLAKEWCVNNTPIGTVASVQGKRRYRLADDGNWVRLDDSGRDALLMVNDVEPRPIKQVKHNLEFRINADGAVSVYGLKRMPVTLYAESWKCLLLDQADELRDFLYTRGNSKMETLV